MNEFMGAGVCVCVHSLVWLNDCLINILLWPDSKVYLGGILP